MTVAKHRRIRVIPTLLIDSAARLVKTVRFGKRTYIGDPINAVRIFNEKEVDELVLLDIDASTDRRSPRFDRIEEIASEAFMPVAYGGGISSLEHMAALFRSGVEKVVLSSAAVSDPNLVRSGAERFGSQSIVVCLDIRKLWFRGYRVATCRGKEIHAGHPAEWARRMRAAGAGEIIAYSIDRDGTYEGYDIELLRQVAHSVDVPVIACGGASAPADFRPAVDAGCDAVAAGSLFVYRGKGQGILITYPQEPLLLP